METLRRCASIITWTFVGIVLGAAYGVVNDQLSVTASPEYYSVFKHQQFLPLLTAFGADAAPLRLQAVVVGVCATWWFGMLLGLAIGIVANAGTRPPAPRGVITKAIVNVLLCVAVSSAVAGAVGYVIAPAINLTPSDWPFLDGIVDKRRAFAVGAWHDGAYLGGLIAAIAASIAVWRKRTA
ncbi:MAG TPA: hypothetical protein VGK19_11190 [Capsulimonadaceae bacterium]|jgi:hypothetical protein